MIISFNGINQFYFLQSDSLADPWKSEGVLAPRLAAGEEGEEGGGLQASRTGLTLGQDPNSSFGGSGTSLSESWGLQKEAPARPGGAVAGLNNAGVGGGGGQRWWARMQIATCRQWGDWEFATNL